MTRTMTCTPYATVRRLLDADGKPVHEPAPRPPRSVRFALDDPRPYPTGYFCEHEREDAGEHEREDAGNEIGVERFRDRLRTAWNSQVLLYVHGAGAPATVFRENDRLQKQCDRAEPGLVQVVPVLWPASDRRAPTGENDHDDARPAADAPGGAIAAGVGDVLRTLLPLLHRRDARRPAERKRISVLAHGGGARVLRDALASWADDAGPLYGAFRNVFLVAADIGQHALETGHRGRCLSDAARNVTVYYANDDWAFSSTVTRRQPAAVTRRLGQAGPADLSAAAKNVYAVDCDDVYAVAHDDDRGGVPAESDESPYFLAGSGDRDTPGTVVKHLSPRGQPPGGARRDRDTPGVVKHLLHALRTGRVNADPATRTWVLTPTGNGGER